MTWKTRLYGYMASGASVAEAFVSIADDLATMRDVALADAGCPEETAFVRDMYAEDSATLATLRAAYVGA